MSLRIDTLSLDANDPERLGRFWADALGWEVSADGDGEYEVTPPPGGPPFSILTLKVPEPKVGQNPIHLDLSTTSLEDQEAYVQHLLDVGATHIDIGQSAEEKHVVLADPEGNELCVLEPGNSFVDHTSRLGSITCMGSHAVGVFWSEVLRAPLVWDQGGETAIRVGGDSGVFITWGGVAPDKVRKNRWHLDLAPPADGDQQAEVDRLIALGAQRIDIGQGNVSWVVLADPDGNELCVLTPR